MKKTIWATLLLLGVFSPIITLAEGLSAARLKELVAMAKSWRDDTVFTDTFFQKVSDDHVRPDDGVTLMALGAELSANNYEKYNFLLAYLNQAAKVQAGALPVLAEQPSSGASFAVLKNYLGTNTAAADAAKEDNSSVHDYFADGKSKNRLSFSSGADFRNPYNIVVAPGNPQYGTLTNGGSGTVAYLQLEFLHRWVFDPYEEKPADSMTGGLFPSFGGGINCHGVGDFVTELFGDLDYQLDVGFIFGNGSNSTNTSYSAQTLAGSDMFAQFGVGIPITRAWLGKWPMQLSLGTSIGMTTERSFEKIYVNEFIGGVFDVGMIMDTNSAPGLFEIRLGAGHLDVPALTGTAQQVLLDGNGIPIFKEIWAPEMGVYLSFPLGKVYLNVEANGYFNDQLPNQWNVKVGATVPLPVIMDMLSSVTSGKR